MTERVVREDCWFEVEYSVLDSIAKKCLATVAPRSRCRAVYGKPAAQWAAGRALLRAGGQAEQLRLLGLATHGGIHAEGRRRFA